jgi:predicted permease
MRANARGATSGRDVIGVRRGLLVAQVALSVVLLFGSLLFVRTLRNLVTLDPGFDAHGVVTASVNFRRLGLPTDRRPAFRRDLVERVRALPGVQAAALVQVVPVSGSSSGNDVWPEGNPSQQFGASFNWVGPGYFETLHTPVVAGRSFGDSDTPQSILTAVVNETFAARLGANGTSAIGRRFTREPTPSTPATTFEIVGVVRNSTYADLKEPPKPVAFLADGQETGQAFTHLVIRSALPPPVVTAALTRAFADVDPRIGLVYGVLSADIQETLVRERLMATLSGSFAVLAGLLTLVGLYGLNAYTVTRRANEIGVRMALGAGRSAIARLILVETGVVLAAGAVIGIALALAAASAAATLLFGVRPYDAALLLSTLVILAAIALAGSYAPARRAMRIDPAVALRAE